jgi:ABC-type amino acid transport substrate-binding protein
LGLSHRRLLFLLVVVIVVAAAAYFLLFRSAGPDLSLQRVQRSGTLVIGLDPSYPPFEVVNGQGQLDGLDVELARELARRLGVQAQLVSIDFGSIFDALEVGRFDAILGGVSPLPENADRLAYTRPYYDDGLVLVIQSTATGQVVGLESGSDADLSLDQIKPKLPGYQFRQFDDQDQLLAGLSQGTLRGAIVDSVTAATWVQQVKGLSVQPALLTSVSYVVATRRGDQALLRAIDQALGSLLSDGTVAGLVQKWLR